ncbi:MAG: pilus assembly protein [Devosiaceae bacterium]|nr:pilus assembly protein [Devosiaceae bacterium]
MKWIKMDWFKNIRLKISRLHHSSEAVAAVEFALILPVLLVLYMGSIEASQVISVDRKMAVATGALGDLVAQSDEQLDEDDLNDFFEAVGLILTPFSADDLEQLVTLVFVDEDGISEVVWSVGYNGAVAKEEESAYTLPAEIIAIARETYVVVAESQLEYEPWGGYVLQGGFNLYKQFFHLPRFGGEIELI